VSSNPPQINRPWNKTWRNACQGKIQGDKKGKL